MRLPVQRGLAVHEDQVSVLEVPVDDLGRVLGLAGLLRRRREQTTRQRHALSHVRGQALLRGDGHGGTVRY